MMSYTLFSIANVFTCMGYSPSPSIEFLPSYSPGTYISSFLLLYTFFVGSFYLYRYCVLFVSNTFFSRCIILYFGRCLLLFAAFYDILWVWYQFCSVLGCRIPSIKYLTLLSVRRGRKEFHYLIFIELKLLMLQRTFLLADDSVSVVAVFDVFSCFFSMLLAQHFGYLWTWVEEKVCLRLCAWVKKFCLRGRSIFSVVLFANPLHSILFSFALFAFCPLKANLVNLTSFPYQNKQHKERTNFSFASASSFVLSLCAQHFFVYLFSDFFSDVFKRFMGAKRMWDDSFAAQNGILSRSLCLFM